MTQIIAIANQKGGVGKTTTTYHLAQAAHAAGLNTLVIDADPQSNATRVLGPGDLAPDAASLADVLATHTETTLGDVIVNTLQEGLDLVPAGGDNLAAVEMLLSAQTIGREAHLRTALATVAGDYELVLIDTNPSIGLMTTNAMVAATAMLIVTRADLWSLDGLGRLAGSIDQVRTHYNPGLELSGILVNGYEARTRQARHWAGLLTDAADVHGLRVLRPFVPKRQVIADAPEAKSSLGDYGLGGRDLAELYATHLTTLTKEN